MAASFGWGTLAASSLVIGAIVALVVPHQPARDRADHGLRRRRAHQRGRRSTSSRRPSTSPPATGGSSGGSSPVASSSSAATALIDRIGGAARKDATGDQEGGSPLAIVLGTVLDGSPRVDGDRPDDLRGRGGGRRVSGGRLHLQPARGDLVDLRPGHRRLGALADPVDVDRDRPGLGSRLAGRLRACSSTPRRTPSPSCSPSRPARS